MIFLSFRATGLSWGSGHLICPDWEDAHLSRLGRCPFVPIGKMPGRWPFLTDVGMFIFDSPPSRAYICQGEKWRKCQGEKWRKNLPGGGIWFLHVKRWSLGSCNHSEISAAKSRVFCAFLTMSVCRERPWRLLLMTLTALFLCEYHVMPVCSHYMNVLARRPDCKCTTQPGVPTVNVLHSRFSKTF